MPQIGMKLAPALIAGCAVILKTSPEAPGEGYLFAEAAEAADLPPGVINVVTADREVSELGGKSAAVILDDADFESAATALARAECILAGQVCASLTRIVVTRQHHDQMVDALAASFSQVKVGNQFDWHRRWDRLRRDGSETGSKATSPKASRAARS